MRLPNRYGQITKLKKKNLRKPFRVRVIAKRDDAGKPIYATLGYYEKRIDAQIALSDYHKEPYSIDAKKLTFNDVFEQWYATCPYDKGVTPERIIEIKGLWAHSDLKNMLVTDIRPSDIRNSIIRSDLPRSTPVKLKSIYNQVLDYAVRERYINTNASRQADIPKIIKIKDAEGKKEKKAFSAEEMLKIKEKVFEDEAAAVLYYSCFSGWRPSEALALTPENVNIKMGFVTGGMKTDAGKNRSVPIHPEILPLLKSRMNYDKIFHYACYKNYGRAVRRLFRQLDITGHTPHDARRTFITLAKMSGMNEYALKKIVGHSIQDLTEKVYTDRPFEWYKTEMLKIQVPCELNNIKLSV